MILIENREILRKKNRELLSEISSYENTQSFKDVVIEESKRGGLTLKVAIENKMQYVHSKYDPEKDAERFIEKIEVNPEQHILFVGVGLGYHIERFHEQYPDVNYSIYEPRTEVMYAYLSIKKMSEGNLKNIIVGTDSEYLSKEIDQLLIATKGKLQVITLPIYEKLYQKEIALIQQKAIEALKDKRNALAVNMSFQKRWTINAIKNFPTVLSTPNILHDIDKKVFERKPAIIVAAGPSLNEEFENLRYIKENGLAYIFSVGSAINALIEHGIYPDAACTYDPSERNQFVIEKIKQQQIEKIPLIFGSSVGFETLENYPGEMYHMITSQDTVSPQLLDTTKSIDIVLDAPSIAVVTFQLLTQLKCNPIILVGQNLGFQKDKRYASGIEYDFVDNKLSESEKRTSLIIKDVYGNNIQTDEGFNLMRQQLEMYIQSKLNTEVINTTKGGAQIKGTTFISLAEVIDHRLTNRVVESIRTLTTGIYDFNYAKNKVQKVSREISHCENSLTKLIELLKKIQRAIEMRKINTIEQRFIAFDKEFNKLKSNSFYSGFVEPMLKVQNEKLSEDSQMLRYEKNPVKKAEMVVESFGNFIQEVQSHMEFVKPYFEEMLERIENRSHEFNG